MGCAAFAAHARQHQLPGAATRIKGSSRSGRAPTRPALLGLVTRTGHSAIGTKGSRSRKKHVQPRKRWSLLRCRILTRRSALLSAGSTDSILPSEPPCEPPFWQVRQSLLKPWQCRILLPQIVTSYPRAGPSLTMSHRRPPSRATRHKSRIQAVLFDRTMWSPDDAEQWLRLHGYHPIKPVHETVHKLRYRIREPDRRYRYRTVNHASNTGVEFIIEFR
jgi:hypothetical protein